MNRIHPKPRLFPVVEIVRPADSPRPHKRRKRSTSDSFNQTDTDSTLKAYTTRNPVLSGPLIIHLQDIHVSSTIFKSSTEVMEKHWTVDDSNGINEDDLPVYLLTDFTIYNYNNQHVVPFSKLVNLRDSETGMKFGASGLASPWIEPDSDGDANEPVDSVTTAKLKLSSIRELNVHHFDEETNTLDKKIYLRTDYAWYILDAPSTLYRPYYVGFLTQQRLFHIVMEYILQSKEITHDSLATKLNADSEITIVNPNLDQSLTTDLFASPEVIAYFATMLPRCGAITGLLLNNIPMISTIMDSIPIAVQTSLKSRQPSKTPDMDSSGVTVTPIVSRIGKTLFKGLEVVGTSEFNMEETSIAEKIKVNLQEHHDNPEEIHWGNQIDNIYNFYDSVQMDGVCYQVGDVVMVNPGEDEDSKRAANDSSNPSKSANSYANLCWFARICYFFEDGNEKMCHVQWFIPGSKTLLQETAHSKSLYFTEDCDDIPIASIFRICNLLMLQDEGEEPPDDQDPTSNDFHCGLMCIDQVDFVHLPKEREIAAILSTLPSHQPCYACGLNAKRELASELCLIPKGFSQHGYDYHVHDFVFIHPGEGRYLLEIAQITKISGVPYSPEITVQEVVRHDEYTAKLGLTCDERRLILGRSTRMITPDQLDGVCFVQCLHNEDEIEKWVQEDYHFYISQMLDEDGDLEECNEIKYCCLCHDKEVDRIKHQEYLKLRHRPLRGLELFSGAGGLGTGMNMSGFVETKYAVEWVEAAAQTYQLNHPDTTVYCQDTCSLLKHAIETSEEKNPEPLLSNDGKTYCPPMPKKGEVEFIYGGPPCQAFSRINHNPRADDPRSLLPANMLSYVEHYNCDRFLLENVSGILNFPLGAQISENRRALKGGVQSGVVKFILRTLIALGYQVRFRYLQAGQYGVPQTRGRVIFWGAKRGLPLPNFPVPMYAFPKGTQSWNLPTGKKIERLTRSRNPDNNHQYAPLKFITVKDAIGDLPPFDWRNPHCIIPATPEDEREARERMRRGILPFVAAVGEEDRDPGYVYGAEYDTPPQNRYQRWLRQGMYNENGEEKMVQGHYTRMFKAKTVEATVNVPMRPGADCKDLPDILLRDGIKRRKDLGFYGRLDGESYFRCALTNLSPSMKKTSIIHPSQKRMISIREAARAQGFPDHYNFDAMEPDNMQPATVQMRQIGNAVPVPLALALGKELGKALMEEWDEREREGSPVV